jgi:hypothetical protein
MQWPWLDYQTNSGDEAAEKHHVNWTDEIKLKLHVCSSPSHAGVFHHIGKYL